MRLRSWRKAVLFAFAAHTFVLAVVLWLFFDARFDWFTKLVNGALDRLDDFVGSSLARYMILLSLGVLPFAASTLTLLIFRPRGERNDGCLRCLRCNHILKGLSQPRCPECGEAI